MAKTIMKLTENLAIVKIIGAGATTISLATDLLSPTQEISGSPTVGIGYIQWTTSTGITIARNGVTVFELFTNEGNFDLFGNGGMLDTTEATSDIVVTITGGGTCFLNLRKMSGYASKIEPWAFGQYDNPAAVGS